MVEANPRRHHEGCHESYNSSADLEEVMPFILMALKLPPQQSKEQERALVASVCAADPTAMQIKQQQLKEYLDWKYAHLPLEARDLRLSQA